ncbi:MAG: CoA transferase [Chloroflexota bacterium]
MNQQSALSGIKVLDFSRVLAGPYCSMLLADFGADVIKIESQDGDDTRQWGPPFLDGESAYYLSVNRNKRSISIDLKNKLGAEIGLQLAGKADILIENFKVGGMKKFGLDYDHVVQVNPKIIFCSITGYGQNGPRSEQTGYDFIIQAQAGIMSITGPVDGTPTKTGVAIVDVTAGMFANQAILAALYHRQVTGIGQYIDISLFDSQLGWLVNTAENYLVSGNAPKRYGNAHPNIVPYETFQTLDGHIALAVGNDRQFKLFCMQIGRADLAESELYKTNPLRVANRNSLIEEIQFEFMKKKTNVWLTAFSGIDVPIGSINDIPSALLDPQSHARDMVQYVSRKDGQKVPQIGPVAKLHATPSKIFSAPPKLGEHTREILELDLGYSTREIQMLIDQKVVF